MSDNNKGTSLKSLGIMVFIVGGATMAFYSFFIGGMAMMSGVILMAASKSKTVEDGASKADEGES